MNLARLLIILMSLAFTTNVFAIDIIRPKTEEDTIIVNFGKKGKMIIYVDNKEDFKALKAYDLNALLSKINIYLDSTYEEDYMNDTSFTFHTPYTVKTENGGEVKVTVESSNSHSDSTFEEKTETKSEDKTDNFTIRIGSLHLDISDDGDVHEDDIKIYHKDPDHKKVRNYLNFHLGLNNFYEQDHFPHNEMTPYVLSPWRSRYFAIDFVRKVRFDEHFFFTHGLEVAFDNYMFEKDVEITKYDGGIVFLPLERDAKKSKLATTYLNVPVMFGLKFEKKFQMELGGYFGYRLGSHSKIKYQSGDDIKEKHRSNFYLNDWRYGLRGTVGVGPAKFFVNYDLNTLFRTNHGPELHSVSFGIVI